MQSDLHKSLQAAETEEDKQRILDEFISKATKVNEEIEKEKQAQMETLRRKLAERRSRMKKQLNE